MTTTISEATQDHLGQVLHWLKLEQEELLEGFYCNKEIICSSFAAREMQCLLKDGHPIGFGIFHIKPSGTASIDILEIHPLHRGSGHGTELAKNLIGHLLRSGSTHVSVQCAPRSSESFWRKLGFVDKPSRFPQFPPIVLWLPGQAA
ncbi:GNAT family N-acetyltransferase [Luteimonas mephitis]|uniref:GNAT family N-acetyltransferase n=1 Tax=Luteimonas mephitis TaxID=83615 RepID=UPI00146DC8AD|nr:GNAT family N-acetyltransferase [Luteimonas mephitis]